MTTAQQTTKTGNIRGRNLREGDLLHKQDAKIVALHHFGYRDQPFFPVTLTNGKTVCVGWNRLHTVTRDVA